LDQNKLQNTQVNLQNNKENIRQTLYKKLGMIEKLRALSFDDPTYEDWRVKTGQDLDQLFGLIGSEQHPCTKAFLNYRIPENFTATRDQMQEYYINILQYQADLLKMYLDDVQNQSN
jgi:hypothetical protein